MSKQLIIGGSGQVGQHLAQTLEMAGTDFSATYWSSPVPAMHLLDIRDFAATSALVEAIRPTVIYLPASLTNVDYCELHPAEGYASNVIGVQQIVQLANQANAKIVYFSSDYIFDGESGPYRETDSANPPCEYGRQKLLAEHYVALHAQDYLIVRTTVVYGWERQGKNFVYRLLKTLKEGKTLRVPIDQVGSPTYAPNLAQAVVELVRSGVKGVYHIAGAERVSRYEFACEAARVFELNSSLIQAVQTCELNQPARRPLKAGMIVEKAAALLEFPLLGYRDGLQVMLAERAGLKQVDL